MKNNTGGPAFPVQDISKTQCPGLSVRAYFASQALAGLTAHAAPDYSKGPCNKAIAERAVLLADTLIAELEKS